MIEIIKSRNESCTGCNRCVRECPMETVNITYQDKDGNIKVKIDHDKCIACGRCIAACKHDARYYTDDTDRFFNDLANNVPISLIAAPAIRTNIPEYKRLFTYLKQLGVNKIYDVSLGADICIWGHIRYLEKNKVARIITQPCPVVVTYCELYRHDLLKKLSPVHSPMACSSIYMKEYQKINDRIAALSPCIAKKVEFDDTKLAEYNITFAKLLAYLKDNNIELPDEETEFDHDESGLGSLFPMPGGLKENIEYFAGKKFHISKAEGFELYEKLDQYALTPEFFLPEIFDVLNCADGCNIGTASSHDKNLFMIDKTMDENRKKATETRKREYYESVYKMFDKTFTLSHFIRKYQPVSIPFPRITDDDINEAFKILGKNSYEKQHMDCGACGSDTCYKMARKIVLGVNIVSNCVFKSKEDAKAEHEKNILAHKQIMKMEKAREADERMRTMLDSNPNISVLFNSKYQLIDCNLAAVKFLRFKTKEDTLAGFVERIAKSTPPFQPDGRESIPIAGWLINASKKGVVKFETALVLEDDEHILDVELRKIPYESSFAIVGYVHDMTETRRRETELIRAKEQNELQLTKIALVVQAARIGLWDMAITGDDPGNPFYPILYSNEFRQILGYTDETDFPNIISSWSDLIHPDDKEMVFTAFYNHLNDRTGQIFYNVEYRIRMKNGEYAYFRDYSEAIRDENGNPLHLVGAVVDVTETKNIILNTERLREEADAASKQKGSFLANMSHEIRTPMNAIIGMTAIGLSATSIEQKENSLAKINDASKHLLGIINDILDMSKIEAGKFELSEVAFDFEKMFQRIANVISYRMEEKKHHFAIYIDRKIPQIMVGDDQRLAQVITNLASNAVKFTPYEGSIKINTYFMGEKNGICTIKIIVSDSGIGISPEQQVRLFQSFQQAESGTSRKYGGTGLGLTISKSIVEMMDGEIWIESEVGKGSTFNFTVKMKSGVMKALKLGANEADLKNMRILAVDDDPYILSDFKGIIEGFGVSCDTASNARDTLRLIDENGAYNLYFVDWKIPGVDGIELTKELKKKISAQDHTLVVMISFCELGMIAEEAKQAGVDMFLQKPLFPSTIANTIDKYFGVKSSRKEETDLDIYGIFEGCHILLAEDVDINREIVLTLFEPTLLKIDCAVNGEEAVRMFSDNPGKYDMIFMDVQMPEMDGYEATRCIRAINRPEAKKIPIVAMTANVFKEDVEKCLEAGMNDHTGKPINMDELIAKIKKYTSPEYSNENIVESETKNKDCEYQYGIAWNDSLLIGSKTVDEQHRQIFKLLSGLVSACEDGTAADKLKETLDALVGYTVEHFIDEEALQLKHSYPGYEKHREMHNKFKVTVGDLVQRFTASGSSKELVGDVNKVLVKWLVYHIKNEDKKIGAHIQTSDKTRRKTK